MTTISNNYSNAALVFADSPEMAVQMAEAQQSGNDRQTARMNRDATRSERDSAYAQEIREKESAAVARLVGGLCQAGAKLGAAVNHAAAAGQQMEAATASSGAQQARFNSMAQRDGAAADGCEAAGAAANAVAGYVADGYDRAATEQSHRADHARDRADDANQQIQDAAARQQRMTDRAAQMMSDQSRHQDAMIANLRA
jgi:hypothetical protein